MALNNDTSHSTISCIYGKTIKFIGDIILISENKRFSREILENLKSTFRKFNLQLTSTSEDGIILCHYWMLNMYSLKKITKIIYTRTFTKETARSSTFLSG